MKGRVLLCILSSICVCRADAAAKNDQTNTPNSLGVSTAKADLLTYQQITHYGNKYQPDHMTYHQQFQPMRSQHSAAHAYNHQSEKPYDVAKSQTPVAMVIIAQPAYIPATMLQRDNVAEQILQYFQRGNWQMRYQYQPLQAYQHTTQPQPPAYLQQYTHYQPKQPEYQQNQQDYQPKLPESQPKQPEYQNEPLPTPQALLASSDSFEHHQQPTEDINRLAQQAAQHFLQNGGLNSRTRTAPAIITGLEQFPVEQQEKIKQQLSEHFGSPLKPLNFEAVDERQRKAYKENLGRFRPSVEVKDGEITVIGGKM